MKDMLKDLLTSKRAIVGLVSALVWIGAKIGWQVDTTTLLPVVAPLWLYIMSQALADHGKSAALINAKTARLGLATDWEPPTEPLPLPPPPTTASGEVMVNQ